MSSTSIDTAGSSTIPAGRSAGPGFKSRSLPWTMCLAMGLIVLGCLPIVWAQILQLWSKEHYQYVLLVPAGVWLICRKSEWPHVSAHSPWSLAPFLASLAGIGLLSAAVVLWSPFLGTAGFLVLLAPLVWWCYGPAGWTLGWRGWLFAWTALPLPFGLDEDITLLLRNVATIWTSSVLDALQVRHLMHANIIELPQKSLFIIDACSGIHSLFVLIAAAVFISMNNGRGLIHTALMVFGSLWIVMVENVGRLTIVASTQSWSVDFSRGLPHSVLGACLFVISLAILLSLDQLLTFLSPANGQGWWRRDRDTRPTARPAVPSPRTAGVGYLVFAAPCLLLFTWQWPQVGGLAAATKLTPSRLKVPALTQQSLPDEINGFTVKEYRSVLRVPGDPLGPESQHWTLQKGGMTVLISLDYPYAELHDLTVCYRNIGWSVQSRELLESESLEPFSPQLSGRVARVQLERALFPSAILMYSAADRNGQLSMTYRPDDPTARQRIRNRIQSWTNPAPTAAAPAANGTTTETQLSANSLNGPFLQYQMLATSSNPWTASERDELLALYLDLRDRLHELCFPSSGTSIAVRPETGSPVPSP
jgi:exosortase